VATIILPASGKRGQRKKWIISGKINQKRINEDIVTGIQ
jgi:hypothetical protein